MPLIDIGESQPSEADLIEIEHFMLPEALPTIKPKIGVLTMMAGRNQPKTASPIRKKPSRQVQRLCRGLSCGIFSRISWF